MATGFEYKVVVVKAPPGSGAVSVEPTEIEKALNMCGAQGWELFTLQETRVDETKVSSAGYGDATQTTTSTIVTVTLIFKRPLEGVMHF
jgi:hypothetical protein